MELCINAEELRKALADIEKAEANGFKYCLSVFKITSAGVYLSDCKASYSDMIEKAHPTDGKFDWGRFSGVSKNNKFKKGKLIRIKEKK